MRGPALECVCKSLRLQVLSGASPHAHNSQLSAAIPPCPVNAASLYCLSWSVDGRYISVGDFHGGVYLFDLTRGGLLVRSVRYHTAVVLRCVKSGERGGREGEGSIGAGAQLVRLVRYQNVVHRCVEGGGWTTVCRLVLSSLRPDP